MVAFDKDQKDQLIATTSQTKNQHGFSSQNKCHGILFMLICEVKGDYLCSKIGGLNTITKSKKEDVVQGEGWPISANDGESNL